LANDEADAGLTIWGYAFLMVEEENSFRANTFQGD